MKTIKIIVSQFNNGDILLGISFDSCFVQTSDGIFNYNKEEIKDIYNIIL